jgi:transposase InsO family protein
MPWTERDRMSLRLEFASLASQEGANVRELCRRYGISPKTGYKWLGRYRQEGQAGLVDRSRRPRRSPKQTSGEVEAAVVAVRQEHSAWGGRKIRDWLKNQGSVCPPPASTITEILRRHGLLDPQESAKHRPFQRFEREAPNELWQLDFKELGKGGAKVLTSVDDHSRFALILAACADQRTETVQSRLREAFRRYGLPWALLTDNGPPWGNAADHPYTALTVWLMRLGIRPLHSRAYHPQTLGKQERFHWTLEVELLRGGPSATLEEYQHRFDLWRQSYNFDRPHQSLGGQVPAARYRPSPRPYPEQLPALEYGAEDIVRKVRDGGRILFRGRQFRIPRAFDGYPVGLRATARDGCFEVFFAHHRVAEIDLRRPQKE